MKKIKSWLVNFALKHSGRFSLLFEVLLWSVVPVLLFVNLVPRGRKQARRRGPWGRRWFYGLRTRLNSSSIRVLMSKVRMGGASQDWKRRLRLLLRLAGSHFMMSGNLVLATECFEAGLELIHLASREAIHKYRILGAAYFMLGDLGSAHRAFEHAGRGRRLILDGGPASSRVRHLGPGWFVAIGHAAMLDFYFKKRLLGWTDQDVEVLLTQAPTSIPGRAFVMEYRKYGLRVGHHLDIREAYDHLKRSEEIGWNYLSEDERFATMDDFWEYEFQGGEILSYTHAVARIQRQWEADKRAPLLSLSEANKDALRGWLRQMGIPEGAWYVCLHVREAGFHGHWNAAYPTVRDANVEDYILAVKTITERGGYVVRVGDQTMKRLPKMEGVFEYAHSNLKNSIADVLLPAGCRFFMGTNSGYATVPAIYGIPNVLTNWAPIALPLWFSQDVMIPKLFFDRRDNCLVDFETMFSTRLGSMCGAAAAARRTSPFAMARTRALPSRRSRSSRRRRKASCCACANEPGTLPTAMARTRD